MLRAILLSSAVGGLAAACASSGVEADPPSDVPLTGGEHLLVKTAFQLYDFNWDGTVTDYEQRQYLKATFSGMDADGDGLVSLEDYTDPENTPQNRFNFENIEVDANGDGQVSFDEHFEAQKLVGDQNGDGLLTEAEYGAYIASKR